MCVHVFIHRLLGNVDIGLVFLSAFDVCSRR